MKNETEKQRNRPSSRKCKVVNEKKSWRAELQRSLGISPFEKSEKELDFSFPLCTYHFDTK